VLVEQPFTIGPDGTLELTTQLADTADLDGIVADGTVIVTSHRPLSTRTQVWDARDGSLPNVVDTIDITPRTELAPGPSPAVPGEPIGPEAVVSASGLLSLRVMASFLLPLLLAAMLVVIFGPLHRWLRDRFRLAEWLAAGLTTLVVLVIVLAPVGLLVARAGADAAVMARRPEGVRLDLRVTHQELGDMIGAARESITVALGRLQDQGEIIVRRRTVIIRRMDDQDGTATETA
jgi:hypothetical protein